MARRAATREDVDARILRQIELGEKLRAHNIRTQEDLEKSYSESQRWDAYNFDLLMSLLDSGQISLDYNRGFSESNDASFLGRTEELRAQIAKKVTTLHSLRDRLDLVFQPLKERAIDRRSVFLVHGHDLGQRESVARYLEKLGLNVVILQEKATAGRTIIEQFEQHSAVDFAVVLLTADDMGATRNSQDFHPRARQNVIFELGYFCGSLGRARVCALYEEGVELPSDFHGVIYISLSSLEWQLKLARELRLAEMEIDVATLLG